jgi:hypothetical protein
MAVIKLPRPNESGHPHDRVRRPGADAREGHQRSPGDAVVPVGEVDGGLLVHDLDSPDRILAVQEGVRDVPASVARDPRRVRDALANQVLDEDLGA